MTLRASLNEQAPPAPTCGPGVASMRFGWCIKGCGWGQVDENGLCLRRCLRNRKVRRQLKRKEAPLSSSRANKQANVMVP
jgi:hypothetical protein